MVNPEEITEVMRIAHLKGLTTGAGGNASIRADDGIYITPSGKFKGNLSPDDVVFVSWDGKARGGKPSSEWRMHLQIYKKRPEVKAVLHCHHPLITGMANLFTSSDLFLEEDWTEEAKMLLKGVKVIGWRPYGTEELAEAVASAMSDVNAVIIRRHGPVVASEVDLWGALSAMESLLEIATISFVRRLLKG